MAKKTFTVASMFKDIASKTSIPISVVGVVKPAGDPHSVSFAKHPTRSAWVDIPETSVEDYEHLSTAQTASGTLPIVRLHLKRPAPDGEVVADLLAMHQDAPSLALNAMASPSSATTCYFDVTLGRWVCPP